MARHTAALATRKYPVILMPLLFGTLDPEVAIAGAVEHWHDPRDAEYHAAALRRIIPKMVTGEFAGLRDCDLGSLHAMILDLSGELVRWYVQEACCPPADLLLRVIMLSGLYCFKSPHVNPVFAGLPVYCWLKPEGPVPHVMTAATFDFILVYEWCFFPDSLCAHLGVAIPAGAPSSGRAAAALKLEAERSWAELSLYYPSWLEGDPLAPIRESWAHMRDVFRGGVAFSESLWAEIEDEWADTMQWLGRFLEEQRADQVDQ